MPSAELIGTLATLLPLGAVFLIWGYCNFKYGWSEGFNNTSQVAPVNVTMTTQQQQDDSVRSISPERRMQILERIFPIPPVVTPVDASTTAGSNARRLVYAYDVESKRYVLALDANDSPGVASPSCSICLEGFGRLWLFPRTIDHCCMVCFIQSRFNLQDSQDPWLTHVFVFSISSFDIDNTACIVTGGCQHSYHRHCILDWVKVNHNDCPNCRAKMWDPEEFDRLQQQE
jgi:Ring finger domain